MSKSIPDLWQAKEDASRLYEIFLVHLLINDQHERIISASRQIRRYTACGPGRRAGLFTFSYEIDSLCELGEYKAAWRQNRLREEIIHGMRSDLSHRQWSASETLELQFYYAPLLFFLGRFKQGCTLLETSLDFRFDKKKVLSYDMLFNVYNGDEKPTERCRVTLWHFYESLGKDLREWEHWEAFVNGFHPRLFHLSGVRREKLLADVGQLAIFVDKLADITQERTTSGVSFGQPGLVESVEEVSKRQEDVRRQLDEFHERNNPRRDSIDRKLHELFPELELLAS